MSSPLSETTCVVPPSPSLSRADHRTVFSANGHSYVLSWEPRLDVVRRHAKSTKAHLSQHCNGRDLEAQLERRHLRRGLFGEQNRRLSAFIVASHKDRETMDAADLCDNKSAGSKIKDVFARTVFKAARPADWEFG